VLNRFNVLNDPVNLIDPDGLESILPGAGFPEANPQGQGTLLFGYGRRVVIPVVGGEAGIAGAFGTEGGDYRLNISEYREAFIPAGGFSYGKGLFAGFWSGDFSELACSSEIGIDTPYGSISVLYDLQNMNFGFIAAGPSKGAGAFAKVKPLHFKTGSTIFNRKF